MKNKLFRILAILIVLTAVATAFSSCGKTDDNANTDTSGGTQTTAAESTTEEGSDETHLKVTFFDVGEADAILIECDGRYMIIDGGNVENAGEMNSLVTKNKIDNLAYLICTHPHEDHVGGLTGVLGYSIADVVLCSTNTYSTKSFSNFKSKVTNQKNKITVASGVATFTLGGANCMIYCPETKVENDNNNSIIVWLQHGENTFLFMGDAENEEEQQMLDLGIATDCTVMKIGHHGGDTSTSAQWLAACKPEYAVISVGAGNSYGYPSAGTLAKLRDAGVKTLRTDVQGDIVFESDGENLTYKVEKNADVDTLETTENTQ